MVIYEKDGKFNWYLEQYAHWPLQSLQLSDPVIHHRRQIIK